MSDYALFPKGSKHWTAIKNSNAFINILYGSFRSAKTEISPQLKSAADIIES